MPTMPTPPDTAAGHAEADTPDLPCAQALLAAVVALMSAYANPAPDIRQDLAVHRRLLARKVMSNLFFLRQHPAVPAPLRQVMSQAADHWAVLAEGPVTAAPTQPESGWVH
ncbi:MAG: hypothetical protein RJA10_4480 [Pseudomonadota bacterium]